MIERESNNINNENTKNKVQTIDGIRIASINVRGIVNNVNKQQQLLQWLIKQHIDVCCINEWCIHHNNQSASFPKSSFDDDYEIIVYNRETAILFKRGLTIDKLENDSTLGVRMLSQFP